MGDECEEELEHRSLIGREAAWAGRRYLTVDWSSSDLWSLDFVLADIIADGLEAFRHVTQSRPDNMTDDQWYETLGEIIDGFKAVREIRSDGGPPDDAVRQLDRAFDLLKKYFLYLRS